jgi:hypothetical protein
MLNDQNTLFTFFVIISDFENLFIDMNTGFSNKAGIDGFRRNKYFITVFSVFYVIIINNIIPFN